MTLGLKRDPNKVFNKLLRKVSMEIIAALLSSVINMVMVFHKSEYLILSIDNIENVWPYISIYQRIGFLLFLEKVLSGIARRVAAIMPLPEHPSFERLMRDRFFPTFRPQYLSMDYLFELDLRREEHCMRIIREYLSKACILKHEGYYPFTERALRNIILSNTGIISKVLYDAFNLIEMASKEGSIIDERFVAKYYMQGRSSIDELALKCPATNFTRGHSWKQKRYDEEKRVWIRSCEACGITEESTTLGFRRFYAYDGKLIGETKINRR